MSSTGLMGFGAFLLIIGIVGYVIPIYQLGTAENFSNICKTDFGSLGKLFSGDIRLVCNEADMITKLSYAFIGVGTLLLLVGAIKR